MMARLMQVATVTALWLSMMGSSSRGIDGNFLNEMCSSQTGLEGISLCRGYIMAFLADHPERWHEQAQDVIVEAWENAFPCPK
jgi:hypothetical protein